MVFDLSLEEKKKYLLKSIKKIDIVLMTKIHEGCCRDVSNPSKVAHQTPRFLPRLGYARKNTARARRGKM